MVGLFFSPLLSLAIPCFLLYLSGGRHLALSQCCCTCGHGIALCGAISSTFEGCGCKKHREPQPRLKHERKRVGSITDLSRAMDAASPTKLHPWLSPRPFVSRFSVFSGRLPALSPLRIHRGLCSTNVTLGASHFLLAASYEKQTVLSGCSRRGRTMFHSQKAQQRACESHWI